MPDIEVGLTDQDRQQERDPQLDRAIAYLRGDLEGGVSASSEEKFTE